MSLRRAVLVQILVEHQRVNTGSYMGACACGWGQRPEDLGLSWAEHIVRLYEQAFGEL
jgi:hypothetical protein